MGINEGQILEAELEELKVTLKPIRLRRMVEKGLTLSPKGKRKIKEALDACKEGKVSRVYDNAEEMIKDLDA